MCWFNGGKDLSHGVTDKGVVCGRGELQFWYFMHRVRFVELSQLRKCNSLTFCGKLPLLMFTSLSF